MKKLIFTSLMVTAAGMFSANAQKSQAPIDNRGDQTFKPSNYVEMPSKRNNAKLGKVDQISDWYSPSDWAGAAGADPFFQSFVNFVMPDSLAKYIDEGDTISRFYSMGVGQIMDPKDDNIDQSTNPGIKLTKYTGYKVDSIALAYLYVRNVATKDDGMGGTVAVKDTLIISYFTAPNNGIKKSTITGEIVANVNWDKPSLSPTGYIGQQKIVLDEMDSTSANNSQGGFENSWGTSVKVIGVDIPGGLNVASKAIADNIVGFTVKFKPGHPYDSNSVMIYQRDPVAFPLTNKRSNYFGYRYFSNSGTPEQQVSQTKYYNNSLMASKDAAYVTPKNNGWVGYVAGNAYFNTQYLQSDFHLTTTNVGLNDIKNDNFAMTNVYPNPATENGTVVFGFNLKSSSTVAINIFNIAGQQVKSVMNETFTAGEHAKQFDLAGLKPGIYMVNMTVNGSSITKKLTITE